MKQFCSTIQRTGRTFQERERKEIPFSVLFSICLLKQWQYRHLCWSHVGQEAAVVTTTPAFIECEQPVMLGHCHLSYPARSTAVPATTKRIKRCGRQRRKAEKVLWHLSFSIIAAGIAVLQVEHRPSPFDSIALPAAGA